MPWTSHVRRQRLPCTDNGPPDARHPYASYTPFRHSRSSHWDYSSMHQMCHGRPGNQIAGAWAPTWLWFPLALAPDLRNYVDLARKGATHFLVGRANLPQAGGLFPAEALQAVPNSLDCDAYSSGHPILYNHLSAGCARFPGYLEINLTVSQRSHGWIDS